jgi:hypothetical protein
MAFTSRPQLYSTHLDLIQMITDIATERSNFSQLSGIIVRSAQHLEQYIRQADAYINAVLAEAYPGKDPDDYHAYTPWVTSPVFPINPDTGLKNNVGNALLLSVKPASTAKTSAWTLTVTTTGTVSTGRYKLYSQQYGIQGTDKVFNADQTSTNSYVTIEADAWSTTNDATFVVTSDDKFIFSIISTYPLLWQISNTLACAYALNSIYLGQSTTDSPFGNMFYNRAEHLLTLLRKKEIALDVGLEEFNFLAPTQVPYDIDEYGNDNTKYATDLYSGYRKS